MNSFALFLHVWAHLSLANIFYVCGKPACHRHLLSTRKLVPLLLYSIAPNPTPPPPSIPPRPFNSNRTRYGTKKYHWGLQLQPQDLINLSLSFSQWRGVGVRGMGGGGLCNLLCPCVFHLSTIMVNHVKHFYMFATSLSLCCCGWVHLTLSGVNNLLLYQILITKPLDLSIHIVKVLLL